MSMVRVPTKIFLIERLSAAQRQGSYSARCHAGTLRVGDRLTCAVDPDGNRCDVDLVCMEIRLTETVMVDELDTNWGGLVVFEGNDAGRLLPTWSLYGSGC